MSFLLFLRKIFGIETMVDSRAKGQRAEYDVRDKLRKATGHQWERVPGSGGFNKSHGLKGDIYLPGGNSAYCIEIKHYADDVINSNLLNFSQSQLEKFWEQTLRESEEVGKLPLLVFKKDRGKWLCVAHATKDVGNSLYIEKGTEGFWVYNFDDWLEAHKGELVK